MRDRVRVDLRVVRAEAVLGDLPRMVVGVEVGERDVGVRRLPADDAAILVLDVIEHDAGAAGDVGQPSGRIVVDEVLLALLAVAGEVDAAADVVDLFEGRSAYSRNTGRPRPSLVTFVGSPVGSVYCFNAPLASGSYLFGCCVAGRCSSVVKLRASYRRWSPLFGRGSSMRSRCPIRRIVIEVELAAVDAGVRRLARRIVIERPVLRVVLSSIDFAVTGSSVFAPPKP